MWEPHVIRGRRSNASKPRVLVVTGKSSQGVWGRTSIHKLLPFQASSLLFVGAERAITLKMEIPGPMPPLIREMLENPEMFEDDSSKPGPHPKASSEGEVPGVQDKGGQSPQPDQGP